MEKKHDDPTSRDEGSEAHDTNPIYLVSTCIGPNEVILGSYQTLDEAKNSIDSHARLMTTDPNVKLNVYAVPLEKYRLYTFTKGEMKEAMEKNLREDYELEMRAARAKDEPLEYKVAQRHAENASSSSERNLPVVQFIPQMSNETVNESRALVVRETTPLPQSALSRVVRPSVLQRHMQRLQNRR